MTIRLTNPNLAARTAAVLSGSVSEVSDLELLREIVRLASGDAIEFVRDDNGKDVVLSLSDVRTALELGWEVRP